MTLWSRKRWLGGLELPLVELHDELGLRCDCAQWSRRTEGSARDPYGSAAGDAE